MRLAGLRSGEMERIDEIARGLDCEETRALIQRFAESTLSGDDSRDMRAHLVGCEECAARYRETIESVGRSAAAAREVRERKEAERERAQRVHDTVAGQVQEPRKHRNWRLRTILLPAFFAALMIMVYRGQKPRSAYHVESAIGEIEVTGRPLASYGEHEVVLRRGARCVTGANSSVRLVSEENTLAVGEHSQVLIEGLDPARARLFSGSLNVEGACTIETVVGLLRVNGAGARGRVALDPDGFLVAPTQGTWTFLDADGEVTVRTGETRRFLP